MDLSTPGDPPPRGHRARRTRLSCGAARMIAHCHVPRRRRPHSRPISHLPRSARRPSTGSWRALPGLRGRRIRSRRCSGFSTRWRAARADLGFEQWLFRLDGALDAEALRRSTSRRCARHAMLRTAFVIRRWRRTAAGRAAAGLVALVGGGLARVAARRTGLAPRSLPAVGPAARDSTWPGTPHACGPAAPGNEAYHLVWSTHHLYVDGWSWPLVFRDVGDGLRARCAGAASRRSIRRVSVRRLRRTGSPSAAPDSEAFWKEASPGSTRRRRYLAATDADRGLQTQAGGFAEAYAAP